MNNDLVLAKIDRDRSFLMEANSLQEVSKVIAMAQAAKIYAKRIHASQETTNQAVEIRLRAERRLGEMLKMTPKNPGTRTKGGGEGAGGAILEPPAIPALSEAGIDKKTSSWARHLAAVPEPVFEATLAKGKNGDLNPNRVHKEMIELRQREARQEKRQEAAKASPKLDSRIIVGDFREHSSKVADGSVSLIFTDPPYNRKASEMLPDLAKFAASKLAEGGSLICYVGQTQLPSALDAFRKYLRYWWTIACVHAGRATLIREYGINAGWKAVLWFVKETRDDKTTMVSDVMSGGEEKELHDWQQAQSEAEYWIKKLCPLDGIVCDPFLGSGTTATAAQKLGRRWIGIEIDQETAKIASARLSL